MLVCGVVPFRCLWFGVINHVLVGDSGVVFLPSDKLLMIHGFLFCGTRFVAALFFIGPVHVSDLSSLLFCVKRFHAAFFLP